MKISIISFFSCRIILSLEKRLHHSCIFQLKLPVLFCLKETWCDEKTFYDITFLTLACSIIARAESPCDQHGGVAISVKKCNYFTKIEDPERTFWCGISLKNHCVIVLYFITLRLPVHGVFHTTFYLAAFSISGHYLGNSHSKKWFLWAISTYQMKVGLVFLQ